MVELYIQLNGLIKNLAYDNKNACLRMKNKLPSIQVLHQHMKCRGVGGVLVFADSADKEGVGQIHGKPADIIIDL